ncbi:hypothetical protein GGR58DRAFT_516594 [Xylaria digitata]|nr:hypothetical protein GGR58DRAFT_516594 [Xylaria digitata]
MTPSTTTDLLSSPKQRKNVSLRTPWCNADNCYRALFPCPSPWVVIEAVRYCATVSANSASNYPTQAIAVCGTGKERYISACSCPATNCSVGTASLTTASHITAPPAPAPAPVVTTTVVEKDTSKSAVAAIVTPNQASATVISTAVDDGAALAQTTNNGGGGSDPKPSIGVSNEPMTTDWPATKDAPLDDVS